MDAKAALSRAISKETGLDGKKIAGLFEVPPKKEFGDLAFPVFSVAGKGNPVEAARKLAEKIKLPREISRVKALGPYVNFFFDESILAESTLGEILKEKEKYGKPKLKGKRILVEYSAPNTNKPLHLGHLRNGSIGMALSEVLEFAGHKVIKANLVNDRGIHICQAMLSLQKFGGGKTPESEGIKGDKFVGNYYVKFNEEAKKNPAINDEASELLKKWEAKDPETRKQWKEMRSWVLKGFRETYAEYGSEFDEVFFESDFYEKAKPLIDLGLKKGVFEKNDEGAVIAKLKKYGLSDKTVLRADGTSIYLTFDLALTKHKQKAFNLDKNIWVVANEQNLYFKQLFKIMELLGFKWAKNCEHLNYGLVHLPEGRMKSREGKGIDADDLLVEVKSIAEKEIGKRHSGLGEKEINERAKAIALAAIKFSMLKIDHMKNFTFKAEESLAFEGESGPYLQYSYARAKSILRKAGKRKGKPNFSLLSGEKEKELVKKLAGFPALVDRVVRTRELHSLCHFLLELAGEFNSFYHEKQVLKEKAELREARLALVESFSIVLSTGLRLLNISVMERM